MDSSASPGTISCRRGKYCTGLYPFPIKELWVVSGKGGRDIIFVLCNIRDNILAEGGEKVEGAVKQRTLFKVTYCRTCKLGENGSRDKTAVKLPSRGYTML